MNRKLPLRRIKALLVGLAAAFTVSLVPLRAAEAQMTGREILEKCDSGDPSDMVALLAGGMASGLLMGQGLGGPAREFCPPNSGRLSNGQYRKVTCDFLRQNPRVQGQDSLVAIGISLLRSYPCPAKP